MDFIKRIELALEGAGIGVFYTNPQDWNDSPQCYISLAGLVAEGAFTLRSIVSVVVWAESQSPDDRQMTLEADVHRVADVLTNVGCLLYTSPSPRD